MTTKPDTHPMTARELGALGIATAAVTLAVGVTLAVLAGHAQLADPSVSAASEPSAAAASVEPESVPSSRVVLVPVERSAAPAPAAPEPDPTMWTEPTPEAVPGTERDDDEREEAEDDRHERHDGERHERRERRRHASFWGDDEEEGFDG